MDKETFFKKINTPPYLIGGAAVALVAHGLGWIGYEYAILCGALCIVGLVLHYKKQKNEKS